MDFPWLKFMPLLQLAPKHTHTQSNQADKLLKLTFGSVPSLVAADQGQLVMDGTAKSCVRNSQHHTVTPGFPTLWMAAFYLPQFTAEDRT